MNIMVQLTVNSPAYHTVIYLLPDSQASTCHTSPCLCSITSGQLRAHAMQTCSSVVYPQFHSPHPSCVRVTKTDNVIYWPMPNFKIWKRFTAYPINSWKRNFLAWHGNYSSTCRNSGNLMLTGNITINCYNSITISIVCLKKYDLLFCWCTVYYKLLNMQLFFVS